MDGISLGLWAVALLCAGIAATRPQPKLREGLRIAGRNTALILPRIAMAIVVAGFFGVLVPADLVATWLGREAGFTGIVVGALAGGVTPGGPMLSFPIVAILYKAGAGVGPLIAYLTAWSVFALHRLFAFEIPMMGSRFALLRLTSSLLLPFLAGILATLLEGLLTPLP